MMDTDGSNEQGIRPAAIQVLEYILRLELSPARWEQLAAIIDIAIDAEAAGDLAGLRAATVELELAGPVRVVRIGAAEAGPPPPKVRERANILVHKLESPKVEEKDDEEDRDKR
jgi:hypothetical protein